MPNPSAHPPTPSSIRDTEWQGHPYPRPRLPQLLIAAVPSKLERWDPRGRAGCPQTQAGAVCSPPTLLPVPYFLETHTGVPHCRGCPLCTLTP